MLLHIYQDWKNEREVCRKSPPLSLHLHPQLFTANRGEADTLREQHTDETRAGALRADLCITLQQDA